MRKHHIRTLFLLVILPCLAHTIQFEAHDHPFDDGTAVDLTWNIKQDDNTNREPVSNNANSVLINLILEKQDSDGNWIKIAVLAQQDSIYTDSDGNQDGNKSYYRLCISREGDSAMQYLYASAYPQKQWFDFRKLPLLLILVIVSSSVVFYILVARSGKDLFIRRINGLESMDEAVGRATEKGKPILFVPGIGDLDDIQTIAGLTILSQLAYKAATYNADLIVPVCRSMVLSAAREVVKEAYLKAGKADAFKRDNVFYLTDDQFGFVAGIDGIMLREQPAANFFLGTFYAESLILAETGFGTGAMQTAGTAQPHQLPFFVVTCDYTLIGEELFAASAYLSKMPDQIGSLKGQDFGKLLVVLLILTGTILEIAGIHWLKNFLMME